MNELKDKDEQYKQFLNYNKPKNKNSAIASFLAVASVIIIGFVCAFIVYSTFMNPPRVNTSENKEVSNNIFTSFTKKNRSEKKSFNIPFFNKRQNLLILGVDSNGNNTDKFKGTRSDTILLANIDPTTHSINAISIPRDSKVYLADGKGVQKINHAHALGGIDLTKKTIEETLGVKIDRYIVINADLISELVDVIGGVSLYVEKPMHYDDYSGKLHVHLDKGYQKLDGKAAEGFLRFRNDGRGDIGRTARQQWFLKGLLESIKNPAIIPQIPEALKVAFNNIQTDMTLYELSHFAALMRDINMDAVEVATLPGGPSTKGITSYWILDPERTQDVIDRMIYRVKEDAPESYTIGLRYLSSKKSEAALIQEKLETLGHTVNAIEKDQISHTQIIGHNKSVNSDSITKLKRKIPEIKGMQFVYVPDSQDYTRNDFTINIAE